MNNLKSTLTDMKNGHDVNLKNLTNIKNAKKKIEDQKISNDFLKTCKDKIRPEITKDLIEAATDEGCSEHTVFVHKLPCIDKFLDGEDEKVPFGGESRLDYYDLSSGCSEMQKIINECFKDSGLNISHENKSMLSYTGYRRLMRTDISLCKTTFKW